MNDFHDFTISSVIQRYFSLCALHIFIGYYCKSTFGYSKGEYVECVYNIYMHVCMYIYIYNNNNTHEFKTRKISKIKP